MKPRILTSHPFLTKAQFAALKRAALGLSYSPRGDAPTDAGEAWLASRGKWATALDTLAATYAETHLAAKADQPSPVLCTHYTENQFSPEHVDQYIRGESNTMNRTVSAILVIEAPGEGGEVTVSDPLRDTSFILALRENELLLFPADCWHEILPVIEGERRSLVRWYADASGRHFSSG